MKITMNKEEKEKTIKLIDFILGLIKYMELEQKLEKKHFIEPRFSNKKDLKELEKKLDETFVFDVPEIPMGLPLRKLMAKTKLHKDELIKALNDLKNKGAVSAMDLAELEKPTMIGFDAEVVIDANKEKLIQYKNTLLKKEQPEEGVLYLNRVGDLYREPKEKYCYPMGETSDRHKIVRFLVTNIGYQTTRVIAVESGNKNEQTTRTEIGKIRGNIEKYLEIDGKDFLEGKKGSGYRINPKYKITLKNE